MTAVELNPVSATAVRDVYGDYVGNVLRDPRVRVVVAECRNFVARSREEYDIIQLSGVDTGAASGAFGLGTMPESHIYTVEALRDYLARLAPGGVLSITRDRQFGWALRLAAIARAALVADGVDPGPRIAVLEGKGYGWATILVKREPFTPSEVAALEDFASRYGFPLVYNPAAAGSGAFDRVIREGSRAEGSVELRPATDDWPFFFHSLRWSEVPRMLRTGRAALSHPIVFLAVFLAANLLALTLLAAALIGWPLRGLRGAWQETRGKGVMLGYFAALGAGFMLAEVALMQRFTLFLGNPVLAVATVLAALLVSSGVGSWAVRARGPGERPVVPLAVASVVVALLVLASSPLRALLHALLPAPLAIRLAVCVALVSAAGFPMGMPFPAGLGRLAERAKPFVPWAWGVNAMVSVVTSLASYLIGMIAGYTAMLYAGAAMYLGALAFSRRL